MPNKTLAAVLLAGGVALGGAPTPVLALNIGTLLEAPFKAVKKTVRVHNDTKKPVLVKLNSGNYQLLGARSSIDFKVGLLDGPTVHFADPHTRAHLRSVGVPFDRGNRTVSWRG